MSLNTYWPFSSTIIISGVGRSGTSILGKLLGSCTNTYYLFEPAIAKYLFRAKSDLIKQTIRSVILEDYVIPIVTGRSVNLNDDDESWFGNYWAHYGVSSSSREDALEYLNEHDSTLIIKTNENTFCIDHFKRLFPCCLVIHINRNGNSVIGSTLSKGWYSDEWVKTAMVDFTEDHYGVSVPWFIPKDYRNRWVKWFAISRIAFVWAFLNDIAIRDADYLMSYERLVSDPEGEMRKFSDILEQTDLTDIHIESIKDRKISTYPDFSNRISKDLLPFYNKVQKSILDLQ